MKKCIKLKLSYQSKPLSCNRLNCTEPLIKFEPDHSYLILTWKSYEKPKLIFHSRRKRKMNVDFFLEVA